MTTPRINQHNITNHSTEPFLGPRLTKAIHRVMDKFKATDCVVNVSTYNMYAEIDLFNNDTLITWAYPITLTQKKED